LVTVKYATTVELVGTGMFKFRLGTVKVWATSATGTEFRVSPPLTVIPDAPWLALMFELDATKMVPFVVPDTTLSLGKLSVAFPSS